MSERLDTNLIAKVCQGKGSFQEGAKVEAYCHELEQRVEDVEELARGWRSQLGRLIGMMPPEIGDRNAQMDELIGIGKSLGNSGARPALCCRTEADRAGDAERAIDRKDALLIRAAALLVNLSYKGEPSPLFADIQAEFKESSDA